MNNQSGVANEVLEVLNGGESAPHAEVTPEVVPSPEVKVEEVKAPEATPEVKAPENVDINKFQTQIENLNIALKQERDSKRAEAEKIAALEADLAAYKEVNDKLKNVFTPQEAAPTEIVPPKYMTQEEVDAYMIQKQNESQAAMEQNQKVEAIKAEISTLEKEWDGTEGKPKYDDDEVLQWQKDNGKVYLSPSEAFSLMKKAEIIDWEIKQRLNARQETPGQEQPGSVRADHTPTEITPKTPQELRNAVIEAMNNLDNGINS